MHKGGDGRKISLGIRSNVAMWRELARRAVRRGGSLDQKVSMFV